MNRIETCKKRPMSQATNDKIESIPLDDKLKKLANSLEKSFRPEFIDSLTYLIKIENQDQESFNTSLNSFNWSKLDYFLQQFKKIVKNKPHLFMLNTKMLVSGHHRKSKHDDDILNDSNKDYSSLLNDYSSSSNQLEYFSLSQILIRFLFKLFKYKLCSNDCLKPDYDVNKNKNVYDVCLVLLSSLADLCYYEEIRIQVIHDVNLKCLLEIFRLLTLCELEANLKRNKHVNCVQLMEKLWSKMCRLSANVCQEKASQRVKTLYSKDFMVSLCRCLDQQQAFLTSNPTESNTELDLDLYHSLIRFLKYASELVNCTKVIIQSRMFVHLCVYMYKLNKYVIIPSNETEQVSQASETTLTNNETQPFIKLSQKHYPLFKDLIKQFLTTFDSWQACSEFYNQIIEGLFIEHLLWLQTTPSNNLNITSKETKIDSKFNYSEFSFNLLYKLCRDYHACRAEFGRVGGLSKYIQKTESMTLNITPKINKEMVNFSYLKEYTILIDILCLACKEAINRLRLREQGFLINLIKLQQRLKQNKDEINKFFKKEQTIEDTNFIDSSLYNKILVALCCFAHDQDSMNILLNNSLIDCLLGYLNESLDLQKSVEEDEKQETMEIESEEKTFSLKKLLNLNDEEKTKSNSKKRKTIDSLDVAQKPKRVNSELSAILSASPPFVPSTFQPSDSFETHATSPTESYFSLSPNIYVSSPPHIQSRCSSAQIFQGLSPNFYSTLSPTTSNEILSSPSYFNEEQDIEVQNQIKFSPSINDESSSCSSDDEEQDEEMEKCLKKEDQNEQKEEINENLSQNIESINHTEACVFYVLSQLSHGDKPTASLIQNFDSFLTCLLVYLKKAQVRNPRALRILNRLTKNQYCFQSFVLTHFPLKLKEIFYDSFSKITSQYRGKKTLKRSKSLSGNLTLEKTESAIEKEMNVYLNSNKAFFDATSYFPSFQSIEFILINNLKSQCISSSDSGYLSLIALAKQKKIEKLASALVSPFILRNSKALNYIMVQLNNLDLVLESFFEPDEKLRFKSILCINRVLSFINYKRDLKQVRVLYEQIRGRLNETLNPTNDTSDVYVNFKFGDKSVHINRGLISKKSEYFNALLNGPFENSDVFEIKDVSYETFILLLDILNCRQGVECMDQRISFDQCVDLVMACDRFMLNDLKDLFICILVLKFINQSNAVSCFKLGWYLSNSFLSNATLDFILCECFDTNQCDDENKNFKYFLSFFDNVLSCLKENSSELMINESNVTSSDSVLGLFRKTLKNGLSEIIKNNFWKF